MGVPSFFSPLVVLALSLPAYCVPQIPDGALILKPVHIRDFETASGIQRRDVGDYSALDLRANVPLAYGGEDVLANLTLYAPDGHQVVALEEFDDLTTNVDCKGDDGEMSLTMKSPEAFQQACNKWDFVNQTPDGKFLLIANHKGCGPDDQRQPYWISNVHKGRLNLTIEMSASTADWEHVAGTFDMDFGKVIQMPQAPAPARKEKRFRIGHALHHVTQAVTQAADQVVAVVAPVVAPVVEAAAPVVNTAANAVVNAAAPVVNAAAPVVNTAANAVVNAAAPVVNAAAPVVNSAANAVVNAGTAVVNNAPAVVNNAANAVVDAGNTAAKVAAPVVNNAAKAVVGAGAAVVSKAPAVANDVGKKVGQVANDVGKTSGQVANAVGKKTGQIATDTVQTFKKLGTVDTGRQAVTVDATIGTPGARTNIIKSESLVLDCVNCYVKGTFEIAGTLKAKNFSILDLILETKLVNVFAVLRLEATITASDTITKDQKQTEFLAFGLPGAGVAIPGIFSLGATASYAVGAETKVRGRGVLDFGMTAGIPNKARTITKLRNILESQAIDFAGAPITPIFELRALTGDVSFTAYSLAKLSFGVEIAQIGKAQAAVLFKIPVITAQLTAGYSRAGFCSNAKGASTTGVRLDSKFDFNINTAWEAKIGPYGPANVDIYGISQPLLKTCYELPIPELAPPVSARFRRT